MLLRGIEAAGLYLDRIKLLVFRLVFWPISDFFRNAFTWPLFYPTALLKPHKKANQNEPPHLIEDHKAENYHISHIGIKLSWAYWAWAIIGFIFSCMPIFFLFIGSFLKIQTAPPSYLTIFFALICLAPLITYVLVKRREKGPHTLPLYRFDDNKAVLIFSLACMFCLIISMSSIIMHDDNLKQDWYIWYQNKLYLAKFSLIYLLVFFASTVLCFIYFLFAEGLLLAEYNQEYSPHFTRKNTSPIKRLMLISTSYEIRNGRCWAGRLWFSIKEPFKNPYIPTRVFRVFDDYAQAFDRIFSGYALSRSYPVDGDDLDFIDSVRYFLFFLGPVWLSYLSLIVSILIMEWYYTSSPNDSMRHLFWAISLAWGCFAVAYFQWLSRIFFEGMFLRPDRISSRVRIKSMEGDNIHQSLHNIFCTQTYYKTHFIFSLGTAFLAVLFEMIAL